MTTTETPGADTVRPRWGAERIGNAIFAAVVFGLGVFALVGAFAIRVPAGQAIGPQVFPFAVAVILLGSGAALVISALSLLIAGVGTYQANKRANEALAESRKAAEDARWFAVQEAVQRVIGFDPTAEPVGERLANLRITSIALVD